MANQPLNPLNGEIRDGRHTMPVRVYFEDTDFSGAVYHANFLRFMERGRTEYLRVLGVDQRTLFQESHNGTPGVAFVVRSMTLEFLRPAHMDDLLHVVTWPLEVRGASITLMQRVERGGEALLEARVRVACVAQGKAQRIPAALRQKMEEHSGAARPLGLRLI